MQVYKTLLLDSSYYPIQLVDWKKAMVLFFTQRAEVVENHETIKIRSTSKQFILPKVLRLYDPIKRLTRIKFNRANVFLRDRYQCQYCLEKFPKEVLTFDHVVPKSRGGKTNWENIVTCCDKCNNKKADKSPLESGLKLSKKPIEPSWSLRMGLKINQAEAAIWQDWLGFKDIAS